MDKNRSIPVSLSQLWWKEGDIMQNSEEMTSFLSIKINQMFEHLKFSSSHLMLQLLKTGMENGTSLVYSRWNHMRPLWAVEAALQKKRKSEVTGLNLSPQFCYSLAEQELQS